MVRMVSSRVPRSAGSVMPFSSRGEHRVVALLYVGGNIAHQGVEVGGSFHETYWEDEGRVFLVLDLDPHLVFGEHVAGAEPEVEGSRRGRWERRRRSCWSP